MNWWSTERQFGFNQQTFWWLIYMLVGRQNTKHQYNCWVYGGKKTHNGVTNIIQHSPIHPMEMFFVSVSRSKTRWNWYSFTILTFKINLNVQLSSYLLKTSFLTSCFAASTKSTIIFGEARFKVPIFPSLLQVIHRTRPPVAAPAAPPAAELAPAPGSPAEPRSPPPAGPQRRSPGGKVNSWKLQWSGKLVDLASGKQLASSIAIEKGNL